MGVFFGDEGVEAAEVRGWDGLELRDLDDDVAKILGDLFPTVGHLGVDRLEELGDPRRLREVRKIKGGTYDGVKDVGKDFLKLFRGE